MAGLIAGCESSTAQKAAFRTALDKYYGSEQDCLWTSPIKMPAVVIASNEDQAKEFDALVTAGLLDRVKAEKTRHGRKSASEEEYELSDMGRANWTADASRPGYGNFCFGHPRVNAVESYSRVRGANGTEFDVSYRNSVMLPPWANVPQVEKAFPAISEEGSAQTASATLIKNGNGWKVQDVLTSMSRGTGS
jgi:hypothetical protein